jgi:vacuolar-type H+-ATPase catalytic subunit A/Vma1
MSINSNLNLNLETCIEQSKLVSDILADFEIGKDLQIASEKLRQSEEMQNLMSIMNSSVFDEKNRIAFGGYLDELLKEDMYNGLDFFATLIRLFTFDSQFILYKSYLKEMAEAAEKLNKTQEFKNYAHAVVAFEEDESKKALEAKSAMKNIQANILKWSID